MDVPEIRYAKTTDGVHLAYQVIGDGPIDLMYVPGWVSNIELNWDNPRFARFLRRLASFSRLIVMDRRGTGCSDRLSPSDLPPLEMQMDDLRVVMDEAGSTRTALFGWDYGNHLCVLLAATSPERVTALVLYGPAASARPAPDHPWGWNSQQWDAFLSEMEAGWGTRAYVEAFLKWAAPAAADDEPFLRWYERYCRQASSPGSAVALEKLLSETDYRHVLPSIHLPTLVIHHHDDPVERVESARYVADHIPGARFVEPSGSYASPLVGYSEEVLDEIEEFLTGARPVHEPDRVLATVLFTDIIDSTRMAAELGDARWKELLAQHDVRAKAEIADARGRYVHTTGDGLLATFDGPARAVRCAKAIAKAVQSLGIDVRAGCHTGEVELQGDDILGIAVHIGARVGALAGPGEVFVSSTVKDLVAGSGLEFEDRGEHELKGVPDRWRLFRVVDQ